MCLIIFSFKPVIIILNKTILCIFAEYSDVPPQKKAKLAPENKIKEGTYINSNYLKKYLYLKIIT